MWIGMLQATKTSGLLMIYRPLRRLLMFSLRSACNVALSLVIASYATTIVERLCPDRDRHMPSACSPGRMRAFHLDIALSVDPLRARTMGDAAQPPRNLITALFISRFGELGRLPIRDQRMLTLLHRP